MRVEVAREVGPADAAREVEAFAARHEGFDALRQRVFVQRCNDPAATDDYVVWKALRDEGGTLDERTVFDTPEVFRALTPRRIELLEHLHANAVPSIKELAAKQRELILGTVMARKKSPPVDWAERLPATSAGKTVIEYVANRIVFRQGEPADSVFFIRRGKVQHAVTSKQGKEAIVALLSEGDFFGEGGLAGQPLRIATATAMTDCTLVKIEKALMAHMLHEKHDISEMFITHLLSRSLRYEEDLIDQLFNSSEKRLARILLLLAHFGKEGRTESVLPRVNQEHLAQMVGTTRSRVSHFMNKFKKLGFVDYDGSSAGLDRSLTAPGPHSRRYTHCRSHER